MKKLLTKGQLSVLIVFAVLIIDQIIKILVKTNMYWHESIRITDWFYIYFTENNGMAFGMEIFGKLFLTTFRIVERCFLECEQPTRPFPCRQQKKRGSAVQRRVGYDIPESPE